VRLTLSMPLPVLRAVLLAVTMLLPAPAALAQAPDQERQLMVSRLTRESLEAFGRKDYAQAEALLRRLLVLEPGNFVTHYNLGCARALQDDPQGAAGFILAAIEHGFSDLRQLEGDPQLAAARQQPELLNLRDRWPAILRTQADNNLLDAKRRFTRGYAESRDPDLRLIYLSAFSPSSFDAARAELARIADWARLNLFPDLTDPDAAANDPWVVIVLPSKPDFMTWARGTFGGDAVQGTSMIAGSYMHDQKRLVAMDLGATLRHEFLHALHWRHSTRLGQAHAIWILEGLGTLVEDCDPDDEGNLRPVPSWRTNTVKRIERIGKLIPIQTLARMSHTRFTSQRPLANYAQARAVFLYLAERGRLASWYRRYTDTYARDPSGLAALQEELGVEPAEFDRAFREWVRALEPVAEEIKPGMASLGIEVDAGTGEGPVIASIPRTPDGSRSPLRLGDVITAIDDRPTRDLAELVRVLSSFTPGQVVRVAYRRGSLQGEGEVTLVRR
jgi:hypothetical protein